jgi:SecD/SecF fusion protein
MLRRLIVFSTVMIVALILMFIQNNVLVGDQELQLLMQKQPAPTPSATAPASTDSTYKITFADLGGNLIFASANEQQAVTKRLAGNERLSKIPVKSLSDVTADHALVLTVGSEVSEDDLKRRLQGIPFKRANEAKGMLHVSPGIDLRGGVEFICQLRDDSGRRVAADDEVMHVLRGRLDERGLTEPLVTKLSNGDVQVVIPGGSRADAARTRKVLEDTGRLEFREVLEDYRVQLGAPGAKVIALPTGGYDFAPDVYHNRGDIVAPKRVDPGFTPTEFLRLGKAELTGKDVKEAHQTLTQGEQAVSITFTAPGATRNEQFTTRLHQTGEFGSKTGTGRLGILFDGVVQSDPRVINPSHEQCSITGHFTQDEIDRLRTSLRAGSLSVVPEVISERFVGATLGAESVQRAMWAMILSFLAIVLFMAVYYRRLGNVANLCLAVTAILIFATLSIFSATITLPGLAGLVLSIGMAVDTNILVFERIREELREEKGLPYAIDRGYDRAFLTILDAHLTTFITALILYYIGSGPVKGFGLTLMIGIAINMFSGIYVGRMLTEWFCRGRETVTMAAWVPPLVLPYVEWRRSAYIFSIITGILGAAYFAFGHLMVPNGSFQRNFDIDFTGGNMVQVVFKEAKSMKSVEEAVKTAIKEAKNKAPSLLDDVRMQAYIPVGAASTDSRQWVFRGRDEAAGGIEAERSALEEQRSALTRKAQGLRNATPPNEVEARKIDKEIEAKGEEIKVVRAKLSGRVAEFQRQIAAAFPGAIAPEGDEINAATMTGERLSLTIATLEAPTVEQANQIATALAKHNELKDVTAKPATAPVTGVVVEVSWQKAPSGLAKFLVEDPALTKLASLLGKGVMDDQLRGQAQAAFDVFSLVTQQAAKERLTIAQPFPASQHFSGQVAEQMKWRALAAIMLSLVAIMAYVAARFEFRFGIGSVVALFHDVVLTVGILAMLGVRIDLNIIAALLTIIGFSINDTIVTYDRVRENLPRMVGKTLAQVIDLSIAQTMSRTVLTTGTVLATVIVLLIFGGEALYGFSLTLVIGFTLGTYSSIFVAAPLLLTFQKQQPVVPTDVVLTADGQPMPPTA